MSGAEVRALGGLAISCASEGDTGLGMRALAWYNALLRLGINVPYVVTHDMGAALLCERVTFAPPRDLPNPLIPGVPAGDAALALADYASMLAEIAQTDIAGQMRRSRLEDAVVTTILARVLGPVVDEWKKVRDFDTIQVHSDVMTQAQIVLGDLWRTVDRQVELDFLRHLAAYRLDLLLGIEQIDLDTVQLLGILGKESGGMPDTELVDLLAVFSSPEANDVVNFSLDILPSVLESRRGGGQQVFSVDGYSGVVARGPLDSLVLTELAYDDELFEQRFLDREMLYYAHEAQDRPPPRSYQILVDASASMRGARTVFARGLAIALAKRMALLGFDASVRFFDSRLYEPMRLRRGRSGLGGTGSLHVAGILAFKGEHGRNYARVFSQFASELERLRDRASVTAYVITHAECHVPVDLVRRIREIADVFGVFMLPSRGTLDLDYLPFLTQHEIVTDAALRDRRERVNRALTIVENASSSSRRPSTQPRAER